MPLATGIIADAYKPPAGGGGPASLTNLAGWWDATDAATFTYGTGVQVASWIDKSPNAFTVSRSAHTACQRVGDINGLPCITSTADTVTITRPSTQIRSFVDSSTFTNCMNFAVLVFQTNLGNGTYFYAGGSTTRISCDCRGGSGNYFDVHNSGGRVSGDIGSALNVPYLIALYRNGATMKVFVNGTEKLTMSSASGVVPSESLTLNVLGGGTQGFLGKLGEVIHVARYNAADFAATTQYLMTKWGLTVQSPTEIAGLVGWWDAADNASFTYSSSTLVSQWNDKSGNGRHLTQSTVAKQPNRNGTQNGLASVVFDGVDDNIKSASFTQNVPFTLVIALKINDPGGNVYASEGNGWLAFMGTSYISLRDGSGNPAGSDFGRAGTHAYVGEYTNPHGLYKNGGPKDPYSGALPGAGITTGFCFNENGGGFGSYSSEHIFEACIYNRILTNEERGKIFNYIRMKWGTP